VTPTRLNADQLDTDPRMYLASLCMVAMEAVQELADAVVDEDVRTMKAACLRLTSIGALAGIVGAKL
jgi:hypothetical protein